MAIVFQVDCQIKFVFLLTANHTIHINVSSENLVLDQLINPKFIFFHYSHHSSG